MNEPNPDSEPPRSQPASQSGDHEESPSEMRIEASWSGPLPPPEALQRYDAIVPGAANRIFEMAERRHQHQIDQEKAIIELEHYSLGLADRAASSDAFLNKLGLVFAFIVALGGMGIGAWLIATGKTGGGLAFLFTPLTGLAGLFVYATRVRRAVSRRNTDNHSPE